MRLSEVKVALSQLEKLAFQLPNGDFVPGHFHVTEVGKVEKHFIDCGGTVRKEERVNFQLWNADDYDHRLYPNKLLSIIELSEKLLSIGDHEVEVEYQGQSIEKLGLEFDGEKFILSSKQTDCLAKDKCGIPERSQKPRIKLSDLQNKSTCCGPNTGCC